MTFGEAVLAKIDSLRISQSRKLQLRSRWMANDPDTLSNAKARRVADSIFGEKDSVSVRGDRTVWKPDLDMC